ncbi:tetratricopeptide repeat protein [Deinococcus detaillensis]|uniref:Tetratricopeptide repeat protein n=1 Tax=Deinococcus detaillensis TaxID=2592048 RepID=A0A553UK79_9DEIO|nr:tetratricopeptide repeat protein [Deinococcus detaillensis]TSA80599.1 tetratricopeptide repeat protein [Deinococcus detaillensis]
MSSPATAETSLIQVSPSDIRQEIGALREAGDLAAAAELLEDHVGKLMNLNDHAGAQALINSLPDVWVNPRVRAMYWLSQRKGGTREEAVQARQEAETAYEAGERNFRLIYFVADTRQLDGLDDLAMQVMLEGLQMELQPTDRMLLLHVYAATLLSLGEALAARGSAQEMLQLAQRNGKSRHVGIANALIAESYSHESNVAEAQRYFLRSLHILRRLGDQGQLVVHLNNYAQNLIDWGRPREAEQALAEARELPVRSTRHRGWLALSTAILHHQYGMHSAALASTAHAVALLCEAELPGSEITARLMGAERLAFDGQPHAAQEALQNAQARIGEDRRYQAQTYLTAGVLAWTKGDTVEAEQQFDRAQEMEHLLVTWDQARLPLYRIALARRGGQIPGTAALDAALETAHNDYPLVTDAPVMADTLRWLGEQPGWRERLEAVFSQPLEGTVAVRLELLGPLEVYAGRDVLRFPLKRAGELLAFLALHGPASRSDILNALFEARTDDKTTDNFKKTLRALRAVLEPLLPEGTEPVQLERQRYRLNPLLDVSVSWVPPSFPAPGVRQSGPIAVRGQFLAAARGEWVAEVRSEVHALLRAHLEQAAAEGNPTVQAVLRMVRALE